ncbi:MAG: ABC-2 type transport system permease protein [Parcubacteria group bacterium Gr01-1014_106]|nr:MAG: ABC-2 type transport system permease protein [Parcubacteria group bacterium Gr01-1014_106]
MTFNLTRISGIILRHLAVYRSNLARLNEILLWPIFELLLWGFFGTYVSQLSALGTVVAVLLGSLILWMVFSRVQQSISMSFLMELWSRNIMNVFIAPISLLEYLTALMVVGLIKILFVGALMMVLAWLFYAVNLFTAGFALIPLALALILFAWAIGMFIVGIVLRFGQGAESIAWMSAFFLQPFGAVFFPLSIYPQWLQAVLWWIPLPHIFEALRAVFAGHALPSGHVLWAFGLNAVYLVAAFAFFGFMFEKARAKGFLLKLQE